MQTPPNYRLSILYAICFTSSLGSLSWGYCLSVFNSIRSLLLNNIFPGASTQDIALLASLLGIGAALGSYFSGKLMANFGRRKTLLICDALAIVGYSLTMIHNLPLMTSGRIISGVVIGINSTAVPLYNVELAPLKMKGIMASISMVILAFGVMLGLAVGVFIPEGEEAETSQVWRVLLGLPILFAVIRIVILVLFLKFETPFYLVLEGKIDEAKSVLGLIYTDNVDQHLQKVIKDKEASTNSLGNLTVRDLVTPKYRRAFWMGIFVTFGFQFTGFTPIIVYFNVFIAESAHHNQETLSFFSALLGITSFLAAVLIVFMIEKFGRRPLMIYGTLLTFIIKVSFAAVSFITGADSPILPYLLVLWPVFFRLAGGSVGFVYISELLPSTGVAFVVLVQWLCSFFAVQTFWPMVDLIGINGLLMCYALFALISALGYQKYLLESKGRTKAELLELYRAGENGMKTDIDIEMKKIPLLEK